MERRATKSRQRFVRAAVMLAGVAGVILIASGVASADVAITVTPNNALVDGQTVTVNGSGWQPGAEIGVCEAFVVGTPDPSDCDLHTTVQAPSADANGNFTASVPIVRFANTASHQHQLVDCADPATRCVVGAQVEVSGGATATVTLNFAPAAPSAPVISGAVPGDGSATLSWTAPAFDGGSQITGYVVTPFIGYKAQPAVPFNSAATTQVVSGLSNGTAYHFMVAAENANGTGPRSAKASDRVVPGGPSAPTIGTAVAGNGQATLSWTAPTIDGTSSVTGYVVTPFIGYEAQPAVPFNSTATTQAVTGLTNGATYHFKVAATNAVGTGPSSKASNGVVPTT